MYNYHWYTIRLTGKLLSNVSHALRQGHVKLDTKFHDTLICNS